MFHLPQPPETDRRTRTAQPDRALQGRQECRVVRVAAVDLDDEFVAVRPGRGDGELAGRLAGRDAEIGGDDPHLAEREPHVVEARSPRARTDREVDGRGGRRGTEDPGEYADQGAGGEGDRGDRPEQQDPVAQPAGGADEVW